MSQLSLEELYVAYFGRAADPAGLSYWLSQEAAGTPDSTIALQFVPQVETTNLYPLLNSPGLLATSPSAQATFINAVYQNLFGHQADPAGLIYWQSQLSTGSSPGFMVNQIIVGALGDDATAIQNKAMVAAAYTNDVADATNPTITWNPNTDPGQSRAVLQGVTSSSTSVTAATSEIAQDIENDQSGANGTGVQLVLGNGGQTFSPTATGGLQTTAANDFIRGSLGGSAPGTPNASELTTNDSLNGGGGVNTLNTVLDNEATVNPVLLNMQLVNLAPGAANQTFNAAFSSGITNLSLFGGIYTPGDGEVAGTTLNVTGLATSTAVGMENAKGFLDNLTVSFTGLGASTNTAVLVLTNNAGGTFDTQLPGGTGVNVYNIQSNGNTANTVTIGSTDTQLSTLNITGSNSLTLSNANTGVTTINGQAVTGDLTIFTGALSNKATITGGFGNDTLNASSATKAVSMSDGGGTDTLIFNGAVRANAIAAGIGTDSVQTGGTTGLSFIDTADATENATLMADVNVLSNYTAGSTKIDLAGLQGAGYAIDTTINATNLANALAASTTLLQAVNAVALQVSDQGLNKQVVAFAFGGNEFIYQDTAGNGVVSSGDGLMEVVGAATTFKVSDLTLA